MKGKPVKDEDQEGTDRRRLLASVFGSDVPRPLRGHLLRTSDVASLFEVSERTVSEWARQGRIPSVRTPGGHRRYPADEINELLERSRGEPHGAPSEVGAGRPD
ncbi:MAG TPA: helix-turn-helix domain-containing protein [Acidimicrobiales bacterium]|nr:helix-turn-helix domain-containing protein [Acidimicrobiales bacterium]